jgi:holliday junction DNA helicase RuvA
LPLAEVRKAIVDEKTAWLTRTPGLGKKTAERLIVDLKDKIAADGVEGIQLDDDVIDLPQDVIDALTHLGYRVHHICRVLRSRPTELTEPEAVIKYFLQNM